MTPNKEIQTIYQENPPRSSGNIINDLILPVSVFRVTLSISNHIIRRRFGFYHTIN